MTDPRDPRRAPGTPPAPTTTRDPGGRGSARAARGSGRPPTRTPAPPKGRRREVGREGCAGGGEHPAADLAVTVRSPGVDGPGVSRSTWPESASGMSTCAYRHVNLSACLRTVAVTHGYHERRSRGRGRAAIEHPSTH